MRPDGPKFWLLGGTPGWRTAAVDGASVSSADLEIAGIPGGPLSLQSSDGSLGGLALPRGVAIDGDNTLYLLCSDLSVKHFDASRRAFRKLALVGGEGSGARQFSKPGNIAIADRRLFVADTGNLRVQQFDLDTLALTRIWDFADGSATDVASFHRSAYVLDSKRARVYRREPETDRLLLILEKKDRAGHWTRIVIDKGGGIWLLNASDAAKPVLEPADPRKQPVSEAGDLRDQFGAPPIRLDTQNRFCLPESMTRLHGRTSPADAPSPAVPLSGCDPYNRAGSRCAPAAEAISGPVAASSSQVYAIDRARRLVLAYTTGGRKLRHQWGPWNASAQPVAPTAADAWDPVDVAARDQVAFVLDAKYQAVYRHQTGRESLRPLFTGPGGTAWTRIATGPDGCVYLYSAGKATAQVYTSTGQRRADRKYRDVATLFARPAISLPQESGLIFDREGRKIRSVDASLDETPPLFNTSGTWQSQPLDSLIYRCEWHRIEVCTGPMPPGTKVDVKTFSHENAADVAGITADRWQDGFTFIAQPQPDPCAASQKQSFDFLVRSGGGRFLSILVTLTRHRLLDASVRQIKAHYPRDTYLKYLPAAFSADDEGRLFLAHFLSIFQSQWDALDQKIEHVEKYFDPDAVPTGPFLKYLARQWLALPLEGEWTDEQNRRLISAVPKIYPRRGQPSALRDYLRRLRRQHRGTPAGGAKANRLPDDLGRIPGTPAGDDAGHRIRAVGKQ